MWLYEVQDNVQSGFKITLSPGRAGVQLGIDNDANNHMILPLGQSLARWLMHADDQKEMFILNRAGIEDTTSGLCLVAQSVEEANASERALVLIDGCADTALGETRIQPAHDYTAPELITYTRGDGCKRELYLFKKGDGLHIRWTAQSLNHERDRYFIVAWDGTELRELPARRLVRRKKKQSRKRTAVRIARPLQPQLEV